MNKIDSRFIALGMGEKDLNLGVLTDGTNRKALTTTDQTIDGVKTFTNTPRTLGSVTNALELVNKVYVDTAVQNALQGIVWKNPVEVISSTVPSTGLYDR